MSLTPLRSLSIQVHCFLHVFSKFTDTMYNFGSIANRLHTGIADGLYTAQMKI